jgi:hypothetical protein
MLKVKIGIDCYNNFGNLIHWRVSVAEWLRSLTFILQGLHHWWLFMPWYPLQKLRISRYLPMASVICYFEPLKKSLRVQTTIWLIIIESIVYMIQIILPTQYVCNHYIEWVGRYDHVYLLKCTSTFWESYKVKPSHAVTCIKRSPFFLYCYGRFHMNWTSFKRSPVLNYHYSFVPKVTSQCRIDYIHFVFMKCY